MSRICMPYLVMYWAHICVFELFGPKGHYLGAFDNTRLLMLRVTIIVSKRCPKGVQKGVEWVRNGLGLKIRLLGLAVVGFGS